MRTDFCSIKIFFNILEYHKWNKLCIVLSLVEYKALFFCKTCEQIFMHCPSYWAWKHQPVLQIICVGRWIETTVPSEPHLPAVKWYHCMLNLRIVHQSQRASPGASPYGTGIGIQPKLRLSCCKARHTCVIPLPYKQKDVESKSIWP